MRTHHLLLFACLLFVYAGVHAQKYNQVDDEGRRHGTWQKFYKGTKQLRYTGTFEHGKEVGTFRFYKRSATKFPTAEKVYRSTSDTLDVIYFTAKGDTISKGTMVGTLREGSWEYYHQDTHKIMTQEFYQKDRLEGEKRVFFADGKLAEIANYKDNKKHGLNTIFSEREKKLSEFTYNEGKLQGPVSYYTPTGQLRIEGNYKNDAQDGVWKYYQNGKLKEEKTYPLRPKKR